MPDPAGQVFLPVIIPSLPPLPLDLPSISNFLPTQCLMQEQLQKIINSIPKDFLLPQEIDLLVFVLWAQNQALAFEDSKRGTFQINIFQIMRFQSSNTYLGYKTLFEFPRPSKIQYIKCSSIRKQLANMNIQPPHIDPVFLW